MATLETPCTPIKRGLIVQRASTPWSISDMSLEESPIIITRLVDDIGGSMTGALDKFRMAAGGFRRSETIWRPRSRFVAGANVSVVEHRPGCDCEGTFA